MYRKIFLLMMLPALLFAVAGLAFAQAPASMAYQGRLVGTTGDPVIAVSTVIFSIYADASGGSSLWAETLSVQPNEQGIFTVELGATHSLTGSIFNGAKRWLGLKVGSDAEMTPRQFLTSSPYAISATNIADSAVTTGKIKDSSITQSKLASGISLSPGGPAGGSLSGTYPDPGIAGGAIGATQLADNAISAAKIAANAVTNAKIADNAVAAAQIAAGAVSTAKLADNSVNSAKIVDNSITSADILDEPGIARGKVANAVTVANSGVTNILSVSITIPAAGYVAARAHSNCGLSGANLGNIRVWIDTVNAGAIVYEEYTIYGYNDMSNPTSSLHWGSVVPERVFAVSAAGTYTYYLNADRAYSQGSAWLFYPKLVLMYYPKNYGTVAAKLDNVKSSDVDRTIEEFVPYGGYQENR